MRTIEAIFEKGVFRPLDEVQLPENCRVQFEPRIVEDALLDKVYEVLSLKFNSGQSDVAARHNEHQP